MRAGDGGKVLPAAPEPERFWRVDEHFCGGWFWYCVDREGAGASLHGKSGESFCSLVRATRKAAEADGRASGLPEWKPVPEPERFWRTHLETGAYKGAPEMFFACSCDAQGMLVKQLGRDQLTEDAAEADGIASGLPEWVARGTGGGE